MQTTALRFLIFLLSASKIMYSYMWNCFCLLEGRDVNRENNNGMDAEAGLKELFLARSQHSSCTDVETIKRNNEEAEMNLVNQA